MGGASWIIRNSSGDVLLHRRRCFSDIDSLEAKFQAHLLAFEGMVSHKIKRVLFGSNAAEFINALQRPGMALFRLAGR
ncbi:unnamed protein product [Arabis nemorensis]|uniref:RNase H type-1 domain-containing protein n=1 Tax=Arabis nemorensis TaxID=586526 RepID=A0A565AS79_9BRAS|nr:unnamed protein product [Arabis nemorensis]